MNPVKIMYRINFAVIILILIFASLLSTNPNWALADGLEREIAIWDVSSRNGDNQGDRFSLQQALETVGVPYTLTTDISVATQCAMVIITSRLYSSTITTDELNNHLLPYVINGGTLVAQRIANSSYFSLFGIAGYQSLNTRQTMTWNGAGSDESLHWFEDPMETTISLASSSAPIHTAAYSLDTATPLAHFDDTSVAVTKNSLGLGHAYSLGFAFKHLIVRNQLNLDEGAERSYSNGFEPTSDTVTLFLRGIYESNVPFSTWKHTSLFRSKATLMLTHDVDSTSGMDWMSDFALMENQYGVQSTYNITTHYFQDCRLSDFYRQPYIAELPGLVDLGHSIGSHSVGHFPDFNDEDLFPIGSPGLTSETYNPTCTEISPGTYQSSDGSLYGELEVSRDLLENDSGLGVQTFRSGHLAWNKYQINVLDALGYSYDSTRSANDVLTNFPYVALYDTSYTGQISSVYEIPMTISDVGFTSEDETTMVNTWKDIIGRNALNYAPTVLLIHPNKNWKYSAEQTLLSDLASDIFITDMETFGDFWSRRSLLSYQTLLLPEDILKITLSSSSLPIHPQLSLFIKNGTNLNAIVVEDENGTSHPFWTQTVNNSDLFLWFRNILAGDVDNNGVLDLADTISLLQLCSGVAPGTEVVKESGFHSSNGLGIAEAVYSLRLLSGLEAF